MSLSAKERILKLRETEFKLNKLQNDLTKADRSGGGNTTSFMSKFLDHHKELMSLPGHTRDSIPYRFGFEAPKRYIEVHKPPKLTLPPRLDSKSTNRLRLYKEPEINPYEKRAASQGSYATRHPSLALQSLITELEDQTEKMAIAFPKIDRAALLNKTPFLRNIQPLNSMRYLGANNGKKAQKKTLSKTVAAYKDYKSRILKSRKGRPTALLYSKSKLEEEDGDDKSISTSTTTSKTKLGIKWTNSNNVPTLAPSQSDISIQYSKTDLRMPFAPFGSSTGTNDSNTEEGSKNATRITSQQIKELRESVAYAIESSNLMGVILPTQRGPTSWLAKRSQSRASSTDKKESEEKIMSAKDALQLLKRRDRELPERNAFIHKPLEPHRRGLIGVEISGFEPQCAFFYRDRNGNYNPHLQHSHHDKDSSKSPRHKKMTKSLLRNP